MIKTLTERRISGIFKKDELAELYFESVIKKDINESKQSKQRSKKGDEIFNKTRGGYAIYHNSYSDAVQTARKLASDKGYEIDEDDWHLKVSSGPKKPSSGKCNNIKVYLLKNGRPVKHMLVMSVCNLENKSSKPYELTTYIS